MRSVFETLALADPKTLDLEQCGLMDMVNVLYYVCIESKHFRTRATNWIAHVFLFACCFIHTHTHTTWLTQPHVWQDNLRARQRDLEPECSDQVGDE